jgi:hypothetical protein
MTVACGLAVIAMALTGCATAPIPPTYTQDELKAICERHNGWWHPHPNDLIEGYCEAFP